MAVRILYKTAAEAEIEEAFGAYETVRQGLGIDFLEELARIEGHLHANPALYQRIEGEMRRAVLRRFPYGLFYVVDGEQVNVLGCLHLHRDPCSYTELRERQGTIAHRPNRTLATSRSSRWVLASSSGGPYHRARV